MTGDLCKKRKQISGIYEFLNKGNRGLKCQERIASQEEVFLFEILKKERKTKILSFRSCCSHKSDASHSDPRPVWLLLLSISLIKEQERSKGSAVGIRPVGKGLFNPDSLLEMSKF